MVVAEYSCYSASTLRGALNHCGSVRSTQPFDRSGNTRDTWPRGYVPPKGLPCTSMIGWPPSKTMCPPCCWTANVSTSQYRSSGRGLRLNELRIPSAGSRQVHDTFPSRPGRVLGREGLLGEPYKITFPDS